MSTALARPEELTEEKMALLKRTLCPDLSNDEMELFAGVCRRTGLDPFAKQIYAIKRNVWNPETRTKEPRLTILTGIDGFRVTAVRTGLLDGQDGPYWCGADGVWRDVWLDDSPPAAAKVVVYRKGSSHGFTGVAKFREYAQSFRDKSGAEKLSGMWDKMGANQIAKCAEALAIRKAFPNDLSGLYTSDEMEQAEAEPAVKAEQPKPLPPASPPVSLVRNDSRRHLDPDGIDRTADRATLAIADKPSDPLTDVKAAMALAARKGYPWVKLIEDINAHFKATYSATRTPWRDVAAGHREATIARLNKLPDLDSAADLTQLCARLAKAEGVEPAAVLLRYAVAAQLPEGCIAADDMTTSQLATACKAFRAKLAAMEAAAEDGGD